MTQVQFALAAPRTHSLSASYLPPFFLIAAITGLALVLNHWTRLNWQMPAYELIWIPGLCCVLITAYATMRSLPGIQETGIYLGFWLFYPLFAAKLTYIATCTNFPLRDDVFIKLDSALAFHWTDWMAFAQQHPLLLAVQRFAYDSSYWQPLAYIPLFALFGPRGRNAEFLTSILLGLGATILIYMVLPTLGPADMAGLKAQTGDIILALRAGSTGPYPYFGIIPFPSFHTVMALLFIAAHRGSRITFPIVLVLNLVMLSAIPYLGDHYLSDMIAGAVIALAAFYGAKSLYRRLDDAPASQWATPFGSGPAKADGRHLEKLDPVVRA